MHWITVLHHANNSCKLYLPWSSVKWSWILYLDKIPFLFSIYYATNLCFRHKIHFHKTIPTVYSVIAKTTSILKCQELSYLIAQLWQTNFLICTNLNCISDITDLINTQALMIFILVAQERIHSNFRYHSLLSISQNMNKAIKILQQEDTKFSIKDN